MYTVSSGTTINANDINQLVLTLQAGAGATESGKYWFEAGAGNSGWTIGTWVQTQSRTTVPVSVTVDTSTVLSGVTSVGVQNLTSSGFFVGGGASGSGTNTARLGGNFTVQF